MPPNLTTRAAVNAWLGADDATNPDNALLMRLIAAASRFLYGYLDRPALFRRDYDEAYDGPGRERLVLRNWPVLSVRSLAVDSVAIPAAASYGQAGYRLEAWDGMPPGGPQALDLCGYRYRGGHGNVAVGYAAGYAVLGEAQAIPAAPYRVAVDAPYGSWGQDQGVTYADGTPLVGVAGSPAAGQYAADATGTYTFAAADAGLGVLISYSFIPSDIEQACIEIVAERYQYRTRIGQSSKSLGGQETVAYSLKDLQDYVRASLQPYRRAILA